MVVSQSFYNEETLPICFHCLKKQILGGYMWLYMKEHKTSTIYTRIMPNSPRVNRFRMTLYSQISYDARCKMIMEQFTVP